MLTTILSYIASANVQRDGFPMPRREKLPLGPSDISIGPAIAGWPPRDEIMSSE